MTALTFFIGKGGVGKTTLSAAYAVRAARRRSREKVLVVSTDPAHSLGDVLERKLGDRPKAVSAGRSGQLFAWQVNAAAEFRKFIGRYREEILEVVESGTIFSREEIEPLLDTTLPGMAEISALLAIHEALASGRYAEIVVDTAPVGHTLRLFEMPERFARFLDFLDIAASRDRVLAETFGGGGIISHAFLGEWREMVGAVEAALRAKGSRVVLVTTPERFALNESVRAAAALRHGAGLQIDSIVLNRGVRGGPRCAVCRPRAQPTAAALRFLKRNFPDTSILFGEDPGSPIVGLRALRGFAEHVFSAKRLAAGVNPKRVREVEIDAAEWPTLTTPLTLTVGKGGVGKTTVSAALAFHQRKNKPREQVTICSTDPAPSLDDIFQADVGDAAVPVLGDRKLLAVEIDSVAQFRAWAKRVRSKLASALSGQSGGVHADLTLERNVLEALLDIVPPGVDELFAVFRMLNLLESGAARVVIDMAPTGHALELLRMPERMKQWSRLLLKSLAPHRTLPLARDLAVEIAEIEQQVRKLASMLHDASRVSVVPVMLAEPLPDRETERLLAELGRMGAPVAPLVVNRVLVRAPAGCPRCRRARAWQMATLAGLARRHEKLYVAPNQPGEVSGRAALQAFTSHLWQAEPRRSRKRA